MLSQCVLDTISRVSGVTLETRQAALEVLDGVLPYGLDGVTKLLLNIWEAAQKFKVTIAILHSWRVFTMVEQSRRMFYASAPLCNDNQSPLR
jgi:hypothetical protein